MLSGNTTALVISKTLWTLIISVLLGGIAVANDAGTNHSAGKPLDVVLVMDSSGSMKKTDPNELRKPAAKLFVSLLGEGDRASIVSFSDLGYPVAFLTPVKGDKNQQALFSAADKISNKGVYTNIHGAIEAAYGVLEKSPMPDHQRVIILMSDGKMDLGNDEESKKRTQQLLLETLPMLKEQGIEVHTIAFTPQSDQALLKNIAEATGGKFNVAKTDKELHAVYTAIFEENKSPNMLPFEGETFSIDNAIKEVTIVGSKDSTNVVLSLITPDGRMITAEAKDTNTKWFVSQQFDLITINKPQPGEWKIRASTGKNKAYVITDLKQELTVQPDNPMINEGVLIRTWLEDKGAIINKPSVLQTLAVELLVDTPEGDHHVLNMDPELNEDGTPTNSGIYNSLIALPTHGKYNFSIVAKGSTFSREKMKLVHVLAPQPEPVTQVEPPVVETPVEAPAAEASEPTPPSISSPVTPHIEAPVQTAMVHETMAHETATETAEPEQTPAAEKPAAKKEPHKKPESDKKKEKKDNKASDKKPADGKHQDTAAEGDTAANEGSSGSGIVKAIIIFLIINLLLAGIGGGVYYFIRKRKAGASDEDIDEVDEREPVKAAAAKDKAA